jgi:hypothetical protein
MRSQNLPNENLTYETSELKLAALLLSEIPKANVKVKEPAGNSLRKTIQIVYDCQYKEDISKLERDFINKCALANVYSYNKALNMIRDRLRGRDNNGFSQKQ